MAHRVVLVLTLWLAFWTGAGVGIGWLFGTLGTGGVTGFIVGVVSTFLWPWIMPRAVDDWMDDVGPDTRRSLGWPGVRTSPKHD